MGKYILNFVIRTILIISIIQISGCVGICRAPGKEPGAITLKKNQNKEILKLKLEINKIFGVSEIKQEIEVIGHAAGNYQMYPINESKILEKTPCNIVDSMKYSFNNLGLSGIEIDVRLKNGELYIMHDPITKSIKNQKKIVKAYLRMNTLQKVLDNYIKNNQLGNKKIYIELKFGWKILKGYLTRKDKKYIKKTIKTIIDSTKGYGVPLELIYEKFAFVSFNMAALKEINRINDNFETYYIATGQTFKSLFGTIFICRYFEYLGSGTISDLKKFKKLDGIWFDPGEFQNFATVLNNINASRKDGSKLKIFAGTYKSKRKSLLKIIRKGKKLKHFAGIIIDVNFRGKCK